MNLTTHYIEEVYSVKPYNADWTNKYPGRLFVKVKLTANSRGSKQTHYRIWESGEWEDIKAKGYYVE